MVNLQGLFIAVVCLSMVYLSCFGWVINALLLRWGYRKARPVRAWRRWVKRGTVTLAVLSVLLVVYGFYEPYTVQVETVQVRSQRIHTPIRIVQVSDLHCDPTVRAESRVVAAVQKLKPDFIVFTGDGVNSDAGIPVFRKTMQALAKIAPLYGVRGNWEAWWFTHVDTFADTGIIELNGDALKLDIRGQTLWLGGTAVDREGRMPNVLNAMPSKAFRLILHHYPAASEMLEHKADLLLCGDTHGGQIKLPFVGQLVNIARGDGVFYQTGLHRRGRLQYYVNRGIGMEGGSTPRIRIGCPPEVTLIELLAFP